jgi:hypothetical protein
MHIVFGMERERESVCVCVFVCVCNLCVFEFVCVFWMDMHGEVFHIVLFILAHDLFVCVFLHVCLCLWERERESVCVRACVRACVHIVLCVLCVYMDARM